MRGSSTSRPKHDFEGNLRFRATRPSVLPFSYFFSHASTFQLLDKPWSQVSSLPPPPLPGCCLQFLSRIGFSNPAGRRFSIECCYLTLSRFPQVNLCARKSPKEFERVVCTRGDSNSQNWPYTRLEDNLILRTPPGLQVIICAHGPKTNPHVRKTIMLTDMRSSTAL